MRSRSSKKRDRNYNFQSTLQIEEVLNRVLEFTPSSTALSLSVTSEQMKRLTKEQRQFNIKELAYDIGLNRSFKLIDIFLTKESYPDLMRGFARADSLKDFNLMIDKDFMLTEIQDIVDVFSEAVKGNSLRVVKNFTTIIFPEDSKEIEEEWNKLFQRIILEYGSVKLMIWLSRKDKNNYRMYFYKNRTIEELKIYDSKEDIKRYPFEDPYDNLLSTISYDNLVGFLNNKKDRKIIKNIISESLSNKDPRVFRYINDNFIDFTSIEVFNKSIGTVEALNFLIANNIIITKHSLKSTYKPEVIRELISKDFILPEKNIYDIAEYCEDNIDLFIEVLNALGYSKSRLNNNLSDTNFAYYPNIFKYILKNGKHDQSSINNLIDNEVPLINYGFEYFPDKDEDNVIKSTYKYISIINVSVEENKPVGKYPSHYYGSIYWYPVNERENWIKKNRSNSYDELNVLIPDYEVDIYNTILFRPLCEWLIRNKINCNKNQKIVLKRLEDFIDLPTKEFFNILQYYLLKDECGDKTIPLIDLCKLLNIKYDGSNKKIQNKLKSIM